MSSFSLYIRAQRESLSVKYGTTKNSAKIGEASLAKVANVPTLLTPTAEKLISIPLENYNLDVVEVLSMAVVRHHCGGFKYLVPLDDRIVVNHVEPIFYTEDLTSCRLDDRTIVTFNTENYLNNDENPQGGV